MLGIVQTGPCQPGSQPQVEVRRPQRGVTDPWVSHVEQERVQVGPKEFAGHDMGQDGVTKLVGGVERELLLLPQHLMEWSDATMPQECRSVVCVM